MSETRWTIRVHEDGRYAEIWDGHSSGVTLLRIGGQRGEPGWRDVERVREFAAAVNSDPSDSA
jgi:hypothetical protein